MENEQINEANAPVEQKNKGLSVGNSIVIAGLLIAIAIIIVGGVGNNKTEDTPSVEKVSITKEDHIFGSKDAELVLVEYSDIDCPYCRILHPSIQKIKAEYGDKVAWVYRDFPLDNLHPEARAKAVASECIAINEGEEAYFTYLNYLFANEVAEADLSVTAQTLGFNKTKFDNCIANGDGVASVEADVFTGKAYGIQGTPFTILLEQSTGEMSPIRGAVPYEDLKALIDSKLVS